MTKHATHPPLKWVVLGCGTISSNFVKALSIADRTHQVTAIASSSLEKAEEFKNKLNLAPSVKVFGDYEQALLDESSDVVYIGLLATEHKPMAIFAIEHGKHVLCEKPLGLDLEETKEIIAAAEKHKRFLMEGYWSRFFPAWQILRHHLNEIGQIQFLQCNMCFNRKTDHDLSRPTSTTDLHHPPVLPSASSTAHLHQARDRILFSAGCYTIMFALWVFHQEMPQKIIAVGDLDEEGNDLWGNVILEFSGNRVANLFYSGIVNSLNSAVVAGSNGCFQLPDRFWCSTELVEKLGSNPHLDNTQVHKYPIVKESKGFDYPHGNAFYLEADHVYDCIRLGRLESEVMPLKESLKIAQITDEIRRQIASRSNAEKSGMHNHNAKGDGKDACQAVFE